MRDQQFRKYLMTDAKIRSGAEPLVAAKPTAVTDILAAHAATRPEEIFVYDPLGKHDSLTYAETWQQAWIWHARLKSAGVRQGDVVHLVLGNGTHFVGAFFGALLLGALVAPMPPRRGANAEDFTLILQERKLPGHKNYFVALGAELADLNLVDDVAVAVEQPALADAPKPSMWHSGLDAETIAVLQFTSGTTGRQKVVCLSHRALLWQMQAIADVLELDRERDHAVSWLPLYHDMGLLGFLLTPLFIGSRIGLIPTETFLGDPWCWLEAISQCKATITAAPPSAWFLLGRLANPRRANKISLASLRIAIVGAEALFPEAMQTVVQRLGLAGLSATALTPAYGMAEIGLAVTITKLGQGVRTIECAGSTYVACGSPVADQVIRIANEGSESLPDLVPGRIYVRSPSLMSGYFDDAEATKSVVHNSWYDTKDFGFLHDGQIYIVGRDDDVINIGGQKYGPGLFEQLVNELPEFSSARTAAFAAPDPKTGTIRAVLLVELRRNGDEQDFTAIRIAAERRKLPLGPVIFVSPGQISITRNGKISRAKTRERFLAGEIPHAWS